MSVRTTEIDLTLPEFWMGDPHPTLTWLQENEPVFWHERAYSAAGEALTGQSFWAVTKYHDVVWVSKQPELFCSSPGVQIYPDRQLGIDDSIIMMDDPEHKWMRELVSKGFTPPMIRRLEPHIRELAASVLDAAALKGECDFVSDIAAALPVAVIGEMLGVPPTDRSMLREWIDQVVNELLLETPEGATIHARAVANVLDYLTDLQNERRRQARDDLVSVLLNAEVGGRKLTAEERLGFILLLFAAGNETTRYSAAAGLVALDQFPDQRARLVEDLTLIPTAVEEILRWTSVVTHFRRTATQDVELRGRTIREGDWVVVYYPSANRDEEVFSDPQRFDVGRSPNPHVTFGGGGPHFCLGASLARLEIRVLLSEVLSRFPHIEVAGPIRNHRSNLFRGPDHVPVRLGPERR